VCKYKKGGAGTLKKTKNTLFPLLNSWNSRNFRDTEPLDFAKRNSRTADLWIKFRWAIHTIYALRIIRIGRWYCVRGFSSSPTRTRQNRDMNTNGPRREFKRYCIYTVYYTYVLPLLYVYCYTHTVCVSPSPSCSDLNLYTRTRGHGVVMFGLLTSVTDQKVI